jgi:hypothetical protein
MLGGFLFLTGVLACNSLVGINDPIEVGGTSGGTTSGGMTSGETLPAPPDNLSAFLGTWSTPAATQFLCGMAFGGPIVLTVAAGKTSHLVFTNDTARNCVLRANIIGDQATLLPGQTCPYEEDGVTYTYAYSADSYFKLQPGRTTGAVRIRATLTQDESGEQCQFAEDGVYSRSDS